MVVSYYRPTRVIVDLAAIKENIRTQQQYLAKDQTIFAVVKANGYGHGVLAVANAAQQAGATGFCVATLDEGIELREAGFQEPIFILGPIDLNGLIWASKYQLGLPITSLEYLHELIQQAKLLTFAKNQALQLHLAFDSGMGRIGFRQANEIQTAIQWMDQAENMEWVGIFTHFATADERDKAYWQQQFSRFETVLAQLPRQPKYVHVSNSATLLWQKPIGNVIRMGISMYGLNPSGTTLALPVPLKPALRLVSALTQVKLVEKGEKIGYGKTYETTQAEWIGTVPIGYADGFIRKFQGFSLLVDGYECEIVGRICMDQLMIRLPKSFPLGTEVVIIGKSKEKEISMQDLADYVDTIHYELACLISTRVPRVYVEES